MTTTTDPTTIALEAVQAWARTNGFGPADQDTIDELCPGMDLLVDEQGGSIVFDGEGYIGLTDPDGHRVEDLEPHQLVGLDVPMWLEGFFA